MKCRTLALILLALGLLLPAGPALAESGMAIAPEVCLECHDDVVSPVAYGSSVHGTNACTSCHVEVTSLDAHMSGDVMPGEPKCVRCHKKETSEHYASVHKLNEVSCADCHDDIHTHTYWNGSKVKVIEKCTGCHDDHEDYLESIHGQAVLAGNQDSAACHDCHGLHKIEQLGEPDSHVNREFHTKVCLKCHADHEMMERNGVFPVAVDSYMNSYHGKNFKLGSPDKVAGCADCHTAHGVLPKDDPRSSVNPANLTGTCAQCHENATPLFAKFYSHGDMTDRANYPILYWTFIGMTGLLVGTFAVFWIHTLLWMIRGFVENREKIAAQHKGDDEHHISEPHKQYVRFKPRHIFLHLTVIISFLGLTLTGLPLKFAGQPWSHAMMNFFGGTYYAGLFHRVCAMRTFF
ncbi:MAG: cytochrome c3 family protein [Desulfuromonadales bacterium]